MILSALKDYFDRQSENLESGIAPEGFEQKEIPFVIVLDSAGHLVQIKDTRSSEGKQKRAQTFLVPQAEKRTAGVKANLLWDNVEYIFGICIKSNQERVKKQHAAFIERVRSLGIAGDEGIVALLKFLENEPANQLEKSEYAVEIKTTNPFMAFQLHSDFNLISERKMVIDAILSFSSTGIEGTCMLTGCKDIIANLHPAIKGLWGANSTGANIVSFNLDAFNSYGKTQGNNVPIGKKAAFAYTTALNYLLRKGSAQKIQIGQTTLIFWSDKQSQLESNFKALFDEPPADKPDEFPDKVKALYKSIDTGVWLPQDNQTRFFILGLAPNVSRISIAFWHVGTVAECSHKIAQHFRDLEIIHADFYPDHFSIWRLLRSIAFLGKMANLPDNLSNDWIRTIFAGLPYPDSLYQITLCRVRANCEVTYMHAKIIKACINRKIRFQIRTEKEITMSLDTDNKNPAYQLGRLFAVLELIQAGAQPGINNTIQTRYYAAASVTPISVMPSLIRLKKHHLKKLERERKGKAIYLERLFRQIMDKILSFPAQLNLMEQGYFAIGYYHQHQAVFNNFALLNFTHEEVELLIKLIGGAVTKIKVLNPKNDSYKEVSFSKEEIKSIKQALAKVNTEEANNLNQKIVLRENKVSSNSNEGDSDE